MNSTRLFRGARICEKSLDIYANLKHTSAMPKFIVTFKHPDAPSEAIGEAIANATLVKPADQKKAKAICGKFFRYGEYADIEIDTDAGTATVLPHGD